MVCVAAYGVYVIGEQELRDKTATSYQLACLLAPSSPMHMPNTEPTIIAIGRPLKLG